ncbi:hypothetical protein [Novosphingobium capsulatum]|uniref:hypothetical protein n=1 Tax=Novosphingobium capsulatum TaxID=13688 RepID=UPI0012EEC0C9|nr:hypothetical protein [Novosphingobium capsulatum]WQD92785.1 hypothetical protein U0041_17650 [Novosphingobium capsulatum]
MQLPVLIAATATPLTALVNPGAIFLSDRPAVVSVADRHNSSGNARRFHLTGTHSGEEAKSEPIWEVREPGAGTRALSKLRTFAMWGDNWDGDGARAPRSEHLETASLLLGFLQASVGHTPNVSLNGDGDPMFTILRDDFELAVTVVSKSELSFLVAGGESERAGLAEFNAQNLPGEIADAVTELRPAVF